MTAAAKKETRLWFSHVITKVTLWTLSRGKILWAVVLLLSIPALYKTVSLYAHLRSDVEALLPKEAESVNALGELRARMPGIKFFGVIVDTEREENLNKGEKFIDGLLRKIEAYPKDMVARARVSTLEENHFLQQYGALYIDLNDLEEIKGRIENRRDAEISSVLGSNLDDESSAPLDFSDIEHKYKTKLGTSTERESDRFSSKKLHLTMLLIEVGPLKQASAADLLHQVKRDVQSLGGPEAFAPGMRVGYTGDIAIEVEETEALLADLSISSFLVVLFVVGALLIYFRWLRAIPLLLIPLFLAALFSFSVSSLPPFYVKELNSNTAFLGSIVLGNGINFGIILLARYLEERRGAQKSAKDAICIACRETAPGTLTAAIAAGVAYGALGVTQFQGFKQFGFIGGLGMLFSWIFSYVLVPPFVLWLDAQEDTAPRRVPESSRLFAYLSRAIHRFPKFVLGAGVALSFVSIFFLAQISQNSLEYDFSKLRRRDTWTQGEGYWGKRMDQLLGGYLTPMAILTDSKDEAEKVARQLEVAKMHEPLSSVIADIRVASHVFPQDQEKKLLKIEEIRTLLTPKIKEQIPAEYNSFLDQIFRTIKKIDLSDLPTSFTTAMREHDGQIDRVVLVYPKPTQILWDGPKIVELVHALRAAVQLPIEHSPRIAGALPVSSDIISSIKKDGPKATAVALGGVVFTVLALFRGGMTSILVLGALFVGVIWLVGFIFFLKIKINFSNFIAFPITFGIGVDYPVNVMTRYLSERPSSVDKALRTGGSAVALCSLTTIIGYSSLLLAQNQALFLFGVIAVLGEIVCILAATVLLPAVLLQVEKLK